LSRVRFLQHVSSTVEPGVSDFGPSLIWLFITRTENSKFSGLAYALPKKRFGRLFSACYSAFRDRLPCVSGPCPVRQGLANLRIGSGKSTKRCGGFLAPPPVCRNSWKS